MFEVETHDRDLKTYVCRFIVHTAYVLLYIGLKVKSQVFNSQIMKPMTELLKPMIELLKPMFVEFKPMLEVQT